MKPGRSNTQALKRESEESGFILVAVLWILGALAILASTYSVYVANASFATHVNDDRLRIANAISSGVELAAYKLLAAPSDDARPAQGSFTARLSRSTIDVNFASEAARDRSERRAQGVAGGTIRRRRGKRLGRGKLRRPRGRLAKERGRRRDRTTKPQATKRPAILTRPDRRPLRTLSNCRWCLASRPISSSAFCRW